MTPELEGIEYRELRRRDFASFEPVVLQGLGELERATGIDETSTAAIRSLRRPGIWFLFALLKAVGRAPIRVFVGVRAGRVVGTASLITLAQAGYVVAVATDSTARGQGIATHLLGMFPAMAARKARPWLALDVESQNETAIRVYRRLGYTETARFGWYVGPTPLVPDGAPGSVTEVRRSEMSGIARWVNGVRPPALNAPLPASARTLSHLEIFSRPGGARAKTWRVGPDAQPTAVVRGYYARTIRTVFVVPSAWDSRAGGESLGPLLNTACAWGRALGSTRTVVSVPDPPGAWGPVLAAAGLVHVVSTTSMVRPSSA